MQHFKLYRYVFYCTFNFNILGTDIILIYKIIKISFFLLYNILKTTLKRMVRLVMNHEVHQKLKLTGAQKHVTLKQGKKYEFNNIRIVLMGCLIS